MAVSEYDALQIAYHEDERVLPLALAIEALPGLHAVRWCGGHDPINLEKLTPASGTRYEGMTHPPGDPDEFWIEAMCDHTQQALDSIYTITAALESDDDLNEFIQVSSPWEGITLTISGSHHGRTPQALANLITEVANERDQTAEEITKHVHRRRDRFTQRGALPGSTPGELLWR